ncbi:hypothetical protein PBT88_01735 [Sphingomonas abietis]|uniref:Uncharacterized protein n=1 Tax=Sphingomonas abietis TaxID=3012344 RepID=A0ABY7NNG7_9SPHN|nr:hypothetical protein [Sphingomonas abietis]WBO22893.1 hypothetical protein PBT88_01735 [Sphingomonas abietis]
MADLVGEHRRDRSCDHAPPVATEERLPEPNFECGDMAADRTVGQAEFGRGRCVAACTGGDLEDA